MLLDQKAIIYALLFSIAECSGEDAKIDGLHKSTIVSPLKSVILDVNTGRMFTLEMNEQALLHFLWNSKLDGDRLATLHCLLLHVGSTTELETEVGKHFSFCRRNAGLVDKI